MPRSAPSITARRRIASTMPLLPATVVAVAVALGTVACAEGGATARSAVTRDSAGVAITESTGPAWGPGEALALSAEPTVLVGEEEGAPEYQFGRIAAATRLSDGRLAVFDGMAHELRFYDAAGKFLSKTGGEGGGPGEYKLVSWMTRLRGDSLMVHDIMAQRITVLGPDGGVARSVNLAAATPPPPAVEGAAGGARSRIVMSGMGRYRVLAPFADGSLLARVAGAPAMGQQGVTRDSAVYVRLAPDGSLRDTVGTFVGDETQLSTAGSSGNMNVMVGPPPFGRTTQVAVDRDGFWLGTADRYELARYDAAGRLVRLVRRPVEPLAITEADVAERKRQDLEGTITVGNRQDEGVFRRMAEQRWENATIPKTMPAHGALMADANGHLWVREVTRPVDRVPRWTVFAPDGTMLGTIAMPEGFRPLEFGDEYVLGVRKDDADVEQLALYQLRPAPRS